MYIQIKSCPWFRVADPEHFDKDPKNFDKDPKHFDADPKHFDADPYPTYGIPFNAKVPCTVLVSPFW